MNASIAYCIGALYYRRGFARKHGQPLVWEKYLWRNREV